MGRKEKKSTQKPQQQFQPNAPELHHILPQQPAFNPHYPDLSSSSSSQLLPPPPSYSQVSGPIAPPAAASIKSSHQQHHYHHQSAIPMAQVYNHAGSTSVDYSRYRDNPNGHSVVIQQVSYNHRQERHNSKVRSFNSNLLLIGIIACLSSLWAYNLFKGRPCLFDFTVHKPNKDFKITINTVRDMHLPVAFASGLIVVLCVIKSAFGFQGKRGHSCYLFLVSVLTFFVTLFTGYLAYLSFYSPCAIKTNELFTNISKTFFGSLTDSLPAPDRGLFGESNILQVVNEDRRGLAIFAIDLFNFSFYFAAFLSSTLLC